jgi:hypothetical protein
MKFACYTDLDGLPDSADALFAQAERESLFFSRPWFENLLRHGVDAGSSIVLGCVVDEGRVLAILPLIGSGTGQWHSLGHLYTSRFTLLLAEDASPQVMDCLVAGLRRLPLASLRLHPVAEDDGNLERLRRALEASGLSCHHYFRFHNWVHRLAGQPFDAYMADRPARVRNTIARKQRKLEREHDCRIRLYPDADHGDLQQGIADYHAVYRASWKAHEQFVDFVDGLMRVLADRGWLRLAILYVDAQPVAAQLWFVAHRKATIFRLAYDEAWKAYSPGSILMRHLMQQVIDVDRVEEIDFLTGNDGYKQDWMSERRQRLGLYCAKATQAQSGAASLLERLKGRLTRLNPMRIPT